MTQYNTTHPVLADMERAAEIGRWMPWAGCLGAMMWWAAAAGGALALFGLDRLLSYPPMLLGSGVLVVALPGLMLILAGFMARTNRQSREANALVLTAATRLLNPGDEVRAETEAMADATRRCTEEITRAVQQSLGSLKLMSDALSEERMRVESVAYATADNARDLTQRLQEERVALEGLARDLKEQITLMGEAIPRQARMMVDAAKAAKLEVSEADSALDDRLQKLQGATAALAGRLESLDKIAEDAARRTQMVHQAVASVENKLEKSQQMIEQAEKASHMAVDAAAAAGKSLEDAVSNALDGARYASAEITERSQQAQNDAQRALTDLRTAGRDAAQAFRELQRSTDPTGDRDGDGIMTAVDDTLADDIFDVSDTPAPAPTSTPSPEPSSPPMDATILAGDPDVFDDPEGPTDEIAASSKEEPLPPLRFLQPVEPGPKQEEIAETTFDPGTLADLNDAVAPEQPDWTERLAEDIRPPLNTPIVSNDELPPSLAQPMERDLTPAPARGDTGWREILADIESPKRKPTASSASGTVMARREANAEALISHLQDSGISLPTAFRPKDKRKIANAAKKGEAARRDAIRNTAGRQVERVQIRLRKDMQLAEMAKAFRRAEQDDALKALADTSRNNRNASSRLSAYLLVDAALSPPSEA